MADVTYACSVCGKQKKVAQGKPIPLCCHKEMEPLPYCTGPVSAETSRAADADEPCADGTAPKKKR